MKLGKAHRHVRSANRRCKTVHDIEKSEGISLSNTSSVSRVSTEVTFWHSAEYGSDFRLNSGEIPRNSAEFRGISPELSRNHFRSQKIPRNSESAEFRGHPICTHLIASNNWKQRRQRTFFSSGQMHAWLNMFSGWCIVHAFAKHCCYLQSNECLINRNKIHVGK